MACSLPGLRDTIIVLHCCAYEPWKMCCHSLLHSHTSACLLTCHGQEPRVLPLVPEP